MNPVGAGCVGPGAAMFQAGVAAGLRERAGTIAGSVVGQRTRCGRELRSPSPPAPDSRNRRTHLAAVLALTPLQQPCGTSALD